MRPWTDYLLALIQCVYTQAAQQVIKVACTVCRAISPGETWGRGLVTIIGDAAHPTTPAIGQGACMALEVECSATQPLEH